MGLSALRAYDTTCEAWDETIFVKTHSMWVVDQLLTRLLLPEGFRGSCRGFIVWRLRFQKVNFAMHLHLKNVCFGVWLVKVCHGCLGLLLLVSAGKSHYPFMSHWYIVIHE